MRSFIIFTLCEIFIRVIKSRRMRRACSTRKGDKKCIENIVGIPEGKRTHGRVMLKYFWTEFHCLRIRSSGRLMRTRERKFVLCKV
jgi:hypothetical protein